MGAREIHYRLYGLLVYLISPGNPGYPAFRWFETGDPKWVGKIMELMHVDSYIPILHV